MPFVKKGTVKPEIKKAPEPEVKAEAPKVEPAPKTADLLCVCTAKCYHAGRLWRPGDLARLSRVGIPGPDGSKTVPECFKLQD